MRAQDDSLKPAFPTVSSGSGKLSFYIVAGPTASGKSDIAVALAERCNGEIVSADAFQIYRGLEVLTAKPSMVLRTRVPHHLIGEIPLTQTFNVGQYLALATQRISEIRARGRLPIVVGGTGLYLRALTHGLADLPSADEAIRSELSARSLEGLQQQYARLDPEGYRHIDLQNPRRLIRAIEVCLITGRPFSSFRNEWENASVAYGGIVCTRSREELYARIDERTEQMFREGVEEEVRNCGPMSNTAAQVLGLKEVQQLLRGKVSKSACIASIQEATRRYAKRQITWLRRETKLAPVTLSGNGASDEMIETLAQQCAQALKAG